MVLAGLGKDLSEAELRARCDCTVFGTEAFKAVDALKKLGFSRSQKTNLSLTELTDLLASGVYPIVYINLRPIDGIQCNHAVVVVAVTDTTCTIFDPLSAERSLPLSAFETGWQLMNRLAILVLD